MRKVPAFGTLFLLVATLGLTAPASADPVKITSGHFSIGGGSSWFEVFGAGFAFSDRGLGRVNASSSSLVRGDVSLPSVSKAGVPPGQLTRKGPKQEKSSPAASTPVPGGATSAGAAPSVPSFTTGMTGVVSAYFASPANAQAARLPLTPVSPAGNALVSLVPAAVLVPGVAELGGAPAVVTPEPASLLLLGSGLALVGARVRARKRRHS